jgi:hypothetical protein
VLFIGTQFSILYGSALGNSDGACHGRGDTWAGRFVIKTAARQTLLHIEVVKVRMISARTRGAHVVVTGRVALADSIKVCMSVCACVVGAFVRGCGRFLCGCGCGCGCGCARASLSSEVTEANGCHGVCGVGGGGVSHGAVLFGNTARGEGRLCPHQRLSSQCPGWLVAWEGKQGVRNLFKTALREINNQQREFCMESLR